ncbi:MAG: DUF4347 domain-containing protein [Labilithrix sp.]|nr:DUF4347 domain-containing protein [Labilithrix sp.]
MVYDRTCVSFPVGLSHAWRVGSVLYRRLGRLDATFGATSWTEALDWLATCDRSRTIAEIQYWGHGRWGRVRVDEDVFDASALSPGHRHAARIAAIKERLVPGGEALVWLRTCEAFGATAGLDFARRLADAFGAKVAGHTHIIGALQSGLHGLRPGSSPDWSASEGIRKGTPDAPVRAHRSGLRRPRTISCFDGEVPSGWFA